MMKKKWDSIDSIIRSSAQNFNISSNYNRRLLEKINIQSHKGKNYRERLVEFINRPIAASFILSGIIIGVMGITNIQYSFLNIENKIRFQANVYQYECKYKLDNVKNAIEEWF